MSIEIDILNGDASWKTAEPLFDAVWPRRCDGKIALGACRMGPCRSAGAHRGARGIDDGGLACHVGIYFRTVTWNGRKVHVGGIGGVVTREDCRSRGYASLALDAAIQTMRANEAVRFRAVVLRAAQFRVLPGARLASLHGRGLLRAAGGTHSLRGDGALCVRHQAARRARARSTYADCRGDPCAGCGWLARRRPVIICRRII